MIYGKKVYKMPAPRVKPKENNKKTGLGKEASEQGKRMNKVDKKAKDFLEDKCNDSSGRNMFSITIDDITFTILCKSEQDDEAYDFPEKDTNSCSCDIKEQYIAHSKKYPNRCNIKQTLNSRDMVCFESNRVPGVYLYAYRSSSELGIWRLGYTRDGDCGLFKGELDYVQGTLIHHELMAHINTNWANIPLATSVIPTLLKKPCHASQRNGKICLQQPFITDEEKRMIDARDRCDAGSFFSFTPNPFSSLKTECSNRFQTPLIEIWTELKTLGEKLESSQFRLENYEPINQYTFNETFAGINANIEIRSVLLTNDSISYILIYCVYEAVYTDNKVTGSYGIALLPSDYSVNRYGIYTCYKQAKMFICKPFFYNSMCHYTDTKQQSFLCQHTYLYAGFIFNCWPYNALCTFSYEGPVLQAIEVLRQQLPELREASLNTLYNVSLTGSSANAQIQYLARSLTTIVKRLIGGKKSNKTAKSHKYKKSQKKRKTQKRRSYSIFRSNK